MADTARPAARPGVTAGWRGLGLAALAGVFTGLGQVPFSLWPLGLVGLVAGFLMFSATPGWRTAFRTGWAFGTGYFALTLNWIVEPFLVDAARHGWMAPFALVFLAGGLALLWGAAFALARGLGRTPFSAALAWSGAMGLEELARGYILTGFPWALVGYIWTETPVRLLAAYTGSFGLTLLTFALAALTGAAILARRPLAALPAALLVALSGLALATADAGPLPAPGGKVVRLVQPNAPQRDKWDPEKVNDFFHRQLAYTADTEGPRPDLVVWSETAIPWDLTTATLARTMIADAGAGVPVVVGFQRIADGLYFNSLAVVGGDGAVSEVYDKHHLVPFGEYVPFGQLARLIGLRSFAARDGYGFTAGPGPRLMDLGPVGRALPLICYEAIFPQDVSAAPARPDWLLQSTNDAWFGNFAGPQQHLDQARMRAIEQGLPMIRVANTGISAVIDARGEIAAELPLNEAGFLDAPLPAALPPTIYARTGDGPTLALTLLLLFSAMALTRRKTD